MKSKDQNTTTILVVLGACGAAVAGLLWWGHSKKLAAMGKDDPIGPVAERIGFFPDLRLGDVVIVDGLAAKMTSDRRAVRAVVDRILSDRTLVSVVAADPALLGFRGTIPRSSILRVESSLQVPPQVFS